MRRRIFIKKISLTSIGGLLGGQLAGCTDVPLKLEELIAEDVNQIVSYPLEGNTNFGYRIVSKGQFIHSAIEGNEVYIYSKNRKVIGITIRKEGLENFDDLKKSLINEYGVGKQVYENLYGTSFQWETQDRKIILEHNNGRNKTPIAILFSEVLINSDLLLFYI